MPVNREELARMWAEDPIKLPTIEIAKHFGVSRTRIHTLRFRLGLPARDRGSYRKGYIGANIDTALLFQLWHTRACELPSPEIAKRLGITMSMLYRLKSLHKLPRREYRERGSNIDVNEFVRLWNLPPNEMPAREIARRFGVGESFLYKFKDKLGLPPRDRTYHYDQDDPTEAEIAERAAAIRASWPEGEEEKRFVGRRREEWSLPSFRFSRRDAAIIPAEQL